MTATTGFRCAALVKTLCVLALGLIVTAAAQAQAPAPASSSAPSSAPADTPTSDAQAVRSAMNALAPADDLEITSHAQPADKLIMPVDRLISDPVGKVPELAWLFRRRVWLARQDGKLAAFDQVATEFEAKQAYYPAIEVLWFAEKIANAPELRKQYNDRMRALMDMTKPGEAAVEAAAALWQAGKPAESVMALKQCVADSIYNERAHYQLALAAYNGYLAEQAASEALLPLDKRVRMFRISFAELNKTLAIDPLFNDAYYHLNLIRGMLPDQDEFLQRTQGLSARALTFSGVVVPLIEALENGKRGAAVFEETARELATAGLPTYAVYLYQAARVQPDLTPELNAAITEALGKILPTLPAAERPRRSAGTPTANAPQAGASEGQ